MAKHPELQHKLRAELAEHQVQDNSPKYAEITDLPLLDAVIRETLRLHPAAPSSLPREVPAGGRELAGFFVPAGVGHLNYPSSLDTHNL